MSDLIGEKFGRLTVSEFAGIRTSPSGTKRKMWKCLCDCGAEKVVSEANLKNGSTKSCGCWKTSLLCKYNTTHGGAHDRLYEIWKSMKWRCSNPKDRRYSTYGGKGVTVCEEWKNSYEAFKSWAYANGYDENAELGECTLDRIDNNGDYEPSNCRFANRITQANNTSRNHFVELNGCKMTIAEFARVMNIDKCHAWYYLDKFERGVKK